MRWLDGTTDSIDMSLRKLQEIVKDSKAWSAAVCVLSKSRTVFSDWKTMATHFIFLYSSVLAVSY